MYVRHHAIAPQTALPRSARVAADGSLDPRTVDNAVDRKRRGGQNQGRSGDNIRRASSAIEPRAVPTVYTPTFSLAAAQTLMAIDGLPRHVGYSGLYQSAYGDDD